MRRDYTNQHGAFVPTETEAIHNLQTATKNATKKKERTAVWSFEQEQREAVRSILKLWGKAERENERLYQEQKALCDDIDALRGLQALNMDGLPHGNKVTHPTEDSAIAVLEMLRKKRERLDFIFKRISDNERILSKIEYAMILAKNADLLRRYYHDGVRPMMKVADEFFVSKATAWRMETAGIDSIMRIIL